MYQEKVDVNGLPSIQSGKQYNMRQFKDLLTIKHTKDLWAEGPNAANFNTIQNYMAENERTMDRMSKVLKSDALQNGRTFKN